ncbi:hypothetical protein F7725_007676 [Dissostichus mawsoni]|uniref:Uncharacterized protein n=1 Tax=Dissostichus mawsoni TaxID=36200 RepID=A0A7J5Y5Z5_DISMA|nr:hypothetical protein F7725_007676 [Dissostichus mawsoni]
MRGENESLFTGTKFSASIAWRFFTILSVIRMVLEDMGLQGSDCKYPGSGEGVGGKPTAATWPWFVQMDEILGQRPSICPPVLLSSIPEDTPRPSSAVGTKRRTRIRTIRTLVSSDGGNLLQGRHLRRQLFPPRNTTDCLQHIVPSSSTMSSSGAMMSPAPMQMLWRTAHAVMT